jgi:hypothetical protein
VNDAPVVANPVNSHSVVENQAFTFTLPANTFTDVDSPTLTYTAGAPAGAALPSWLHFDAATRTFSGVPAGPTSPMIMVTATDSGGRSVSDTFILAVTAAPAGETLYQNTSVTQILTGSSPNDIFVLGGSSTGYQWGPTQDGNGIVIWNNAGYDILFGFEQLRFTNKSVNIAPPSGNVVQDDPELVQHLTGKGTNDIFAINGPSTDYQWGKTAAGTGIVIWTVSATDDTYDILNGFEKIQFTDQTVDVSGLVT